MPLLSTRMHTYTMQRHACILLWQVQKNKWCQLVCAKSHQYFAIFFFVNVLIAEHVAWSQHRQFSSTALPHRLIYIYTYIHNFLEQTSLQSLYSQKIDKFQVRFKSLQNLWWHLISPNNSLFHVLATVLVLEVISLHQELLCIWLTNCSLWLDRPRAWHSLPTNIKTRANTRTTFCYHLKTFCSGLATVVITPSQLVFVSF